MLHLFRKYSVLKQKLLLLGLEPSTQRLVDKRVAIWLLKSARKFFAFNQRIKL